MKFRQLILNVLALVTLAFVPAGAASTVYADPPCGNTQAAQQVLSGITQAGGNCGQDRVNNLFTTVVNLLSIIVGLTSVIVLIISGFKYITSGGDSAKVANAKSTLLYALVGLAIASLTQLLIRFVLYQVNK